MVLEQAANDFGGLLDVEAAEIRVRDANALRIALKTTGDSIIEAAGTLAASGVVAGRDADLTLRAGALAVDQLAVGGALSMTSALGAALGATTVGGDLQVTSVGELAQTGAVQVGGQSIFNAGSGVIALSQASGTLVRGASFAGSTLQIAGAVRLSAGPSAALEGDLVRIQSPVRGSAASRDELTLSAEGGSIVFEQAIGGEGDARLDALTVTDAVNLRFDQAVRIDGDLTLRASGRVVFGRGLCSLRAAG